MKKGKLFTKGLLNLFCSFLIAFAPVIIEKTNCVLMWGEPECPEALSKLYLDK